MSLELTLLGWTIVLGLIQIAVAGNAVVGQKGLGWAASPRDTNTEPATGVAGRLVRAQSNLLETFAFFATAILIAHIAGREGSLTHWGAQLFFWARLVYVPLYAFGIPYVRTLVWLVSLIGLILVLVAVLGPG